MSISIYIVDDEYMAIQYFRRLLDQTGIMYTFAGYALNGVKALPEILKHKPDLVFADISMPVMDGIELAEKVHEKNPGQRMIILTAYKSFEYAKAGLKAGVMDYILKNELNVSSLQKLLTETAGILDEDRKKESIVRQNNYRKFILSKDEQSNLLLTTTGNKRVAVISIAHRLEIWLDHWEVKPASLPPDTFEMENLAYPDGVICQSVVEMADKEYAAIFYLEETVHDEKYVLRATAGALEKYLKANTKEVWCLMIAAPTFYPLNIPGLYFEAFEMQKWIYTMPDRSIFFSADVADEPHRERTELDGVFYRFGEHLQEGEQNEARELLLQTFEQAKPGRNFWEYSESLIRFMTYMKEFAGKQRLNMEDFSVKNLYTYSGDAEEALLRYLDGMFSMYSKGLEKLYSRHTRLATEYIRKHYAEDISIPDIAEAVDISEGHLRKCFKQETGEKIVDYIMSCRLEQAKRLMQHGERVLDNVWKQTGFTSAQYFSYAFKKKEGMSPREYMKRNI